MSINRKDLADDYDEVNRIDEHVTPASLNTNSLMQDLQTEQEKAGAVNRLNSLQTNMNNSVVMERGSTYPCSPQLGKGITKTSALHLVDMESKEYEDKKKRL